MAKRWEEMTNMVLLREQEATAADVLAATYVDLACDQRLGHASVRLYLLLSAWEEQGVRHPTLSRLAHKLGVERSGVSRSINQLVDCGWILKMPDMAGGQQLGTIYALRNGYRPTETAERNLDNAIVVLRSPQHPPAETNPSVGARNAVYSGENGDFRNIGAVNSAAVAEVPVLVPPGGDEVPEVYEVPVPLTPEEDEVPGSLDLEDNYLPPLTGKRGFGGETAPKHSTRPKVAVKTPKVGYIEPVVPDELLFFHETLLPLPGYLPTERFFARLTAEFAILSLDTEAVKMADWIIRNNKGNQKRDCSVLFILNWLRTALKREHAPSPFTRSQTGLRGPGGRQENNTVEYAVQGILAGEEITETDVSWDPTLWPQITAEVERRRCLPNRPR